jgi:hypothetical protein
VTSFALASPPRPRLLPCMGSKRRSPCSRTICVVGLARIMPFGAMTASYIVHVVEEFMAEAGAAKRLEFRSEARRIRSRASLDRHGGVVLLDFAAPLKHMVVDNWTLRLLVCARISMF